MFVAFLASHWSCGAVPEVWRAAGDSFQCSEREQSHPHVKVWTSSRLRLVRWSTLSAATSAQSCSGCGGPTTSTRSVSCAFSIACSTECIGATDRACGTASPLPGFSKRCSVRLFRVAKKWSSARPAKSCDPVDRRVINAGLWSGVFGNTLTSEVICNDAGTSW